MWLMDERKSLAHDDLTIGWVNVNNEIDRTEGIQIAR